MIEYLKFFEEHQKFAAAAVIAFAVVIWLIGDAVAEVVRAWRGK